MMPCVNLPLKTLPLHKDGEVAALGSPERSPTVANTVAFTLSIVHLQDLIDLYDLCKCRTTNMQ